MKMISNPLHLKKRTLILVVFFLLLFSAATSKLNANTDTTYAISFQVNMTKTILDGLFRPDSGSVFVVINNLTVHRLVPGPGNLYSFLVNDGLDSAATYLFKFRINDTIWESVTRSVVAKPGTTYINVWWDDESLNINTFSIDMAFMVENGSFLPSTDSLFLVGSMNGWEGSPPLTRADTTKYIYDITYSDLIPGDIHQYKFRINRDSAGFELQEKPNRMIRIMGGAQTANHYFNNFNPMMQPMTFICHMSYFISTYKFNPGSDFVDVSGNFNHWGEGGVLFDPDNDSVYSLGTLIDTTFFTKPLEFKFRINGDSLNGELQDKPQRTYIFRDTTFMPPNVFSAWYDDKNPEVPTPPWVSNVYIQGKFINHQVLCGIYTYNNVNGIPEDSTTFQWYRGNDSLMIDVTPIDSATKISYTVDTLDIGKWLVFEVTPRAAYGDSLEGLPARVLSPSKIGGVGMNELERISVRVYPNPADDMLMIVSSTELGRMEVFNLIGQVIQEKKLPRTVSSSLDVSSLNPGIYLLKVYGVKSGSGMVKFLKR